MGKKSSAAAAEDRIRLLEGRHDVDAANVPSAITDDPVGLAAVVQSAAELAVARTELLARVSLVIHEGRETADARATVELACDYGRGQLLFVRDDATRAARVDPDAPADPAALAEQERAAATLFPYTSGSLRSMGPDSLLSVIEPLVKQLPADPAGVNGPQTRLGRASERLSDALSVVDREGGEDRDAFAQLFAARASFDRAARVHALRVESALLREGREAELGRFLKAKDPAYSARRRASVPVEEEPGIDAVDTETEAPQPLMSPTA